MKAFLILTAILGLAGCSSINDVLVTRTNVEILTPPAGIVAGCPSEIERVVPAGPRYTEEEAAEVSKRNRVAYVQCRNTVGEIVKYYQDQKNAVEKTNKKD